MISGGKLVTVQESNFLPLSWRTGETDRKVYSDFYSCLNFVDGSTKPD